MATPPDFVPPTFVTPVNLSANWGPKLFGILFSTGATGIIIVQCYDYFTHYKADSRRMKSLVAGLLLITLAETGCNIAYAYDGLVKHFGEYNPPFPPTFFVTFFATAFIAFAVQGFFARRAYGVSKSIPLLCVVILGILFSFAGNLAPPIIALKPGRFDLESLTLWTQIGSWSSAATDLVLCSVFFYYAQRLRSGFSRATDTVIESLLRMSLSTTALTTAIAMGQALAIRLEPVGYPYQFVFGYLLGSSYMVSFMFVLNSRQRLQLQVEQEQRKPRNISSGDVGTVLSGDIAVMLETSIQVDDEHSEEKTEIRSGSLALLPYTNKEVVDLERGGKLPRGGL